MPQFQKKFIVLIVFSLTFFISQSTLGLVLENYNNSDLQKILANKTLGYYPGSFDPFHKGHQSIIDQVLDKKYVDFVLIYPAWGGDEFKNRTPIETRLKMIFALYGEHPNVIVTRLNPFDLQLKLTRPNNHKTLRGRKLVEPSFSGLQFIGILGSDTAFSLIYDSRKRNSFLEGLVVPDKYKNHTIGGIINLPVQKFIVALRTGDQFNKERKYIGHRPIMSILELTQHSDKSSTIVRKKVQSQQDISQLVPEQVTNIIVSDGLYQ